ncbi:hypothetical protein [Aurantiacibacter zhengii]|uniref:hypothetical protein n=1 Tax=Aurantiacibacter zhengii TaxID=2307003 RepID=UPI0011C232B4|nr:hypothetical protein [Aurantiacibacter zhengii]
MMKWPPSLTVLTLLLGACSQSSEPSEDAAQPAPEATPVAEEPSPKPERTIDPDVEAAGSQDEARADAGGMQDTIPERFHGLWAESDADCEIRGHQRYEIGAREVGFFESTGIVQNVRADGDYAAATLSEQYGDAPPAEYVFYMALESADVMRIRYDDDPRFRIYRCP